MDYNIIIKRDNARRLPTAVMLRTILSDLKLMYVLNPNGRFERQNPTMLLVSGCPQ